MTIGHLIAGAMALFLSSGASAKNAPADAVSKARAVEIAAHAAASEALDPALYKDVSTMGPYDFDRFAQERFRTAGSQERTLLKNLRRDLLGHRFWLVDMNVPPMEADLDGGEIIVNGGGGFWAFIDSSTGKVLRSIVWK